MPVLKPKIRGFICASSHPDGCAAHVQEQIDYVKSQPALENAPKKVLVIGASTGYGLASRIVPAFGAGAATMGVFFEREGTETKPGFPGWYNSVAFEEKAKEAGLYARSFNGDAFSTEMKEQVIAAIKEDMGQVDMIVYSLASPRRTDPTDGETYRSVLKPTGGTYTQLSLNTDKGQVEEVSIEPATEQEIADTVKVMGGEDWKMWIDALKEADALSDDFRTVAYSYIGPEITWAVYTDGTIGRAKEHLEATAAEMNTQFGENTALVSVNKALVTQASSAIPVVPLYIAILYKVMKEKEIHEGTIEQIQRLFTEHYCAASGPQLDDKGRIRIDDWEMREDVQAKVLEIWQGISTEKLATETDFAGYQKEFLKLFGFGLEGVDYDADTETLRSVPSLA